MTQAVGEHIQRGIKGMRTCCGDYQYGDMDWCITRVQGHRTFVWKCPVCGKPVCWEALEQVEVA